MILEERNLSALKHGCGEDVVDGADSSRQVMACLNAGGERNRAR